MLVCGSRRYCRGDCSVFLGWRERGDFRRAMDRPRQQVGTVSQETRCGESHQNTSKRK